MSLPSLPVLKAVQTLLQTATGKPFGLGRVPVDAGEQYGVLWPVTRADDGSPLGDAADWSEQMIQATLVGLRLDQALWLQDRAREVMVDQHPDASYVHPFTVTGMRVLQRRLDTELGPDDAEGGIVSTISRYVVVVTGA